MGGGAQGRNRERKTEKGQLPIWGALWTHPEIWGCSRTSDPQGEFKRAERRTTFYLNSSTTARKLFFLIPRYYCWSFTLCVTSLMFSGISREGLKKYSFMFVSANMRMYLDGVSTWQVKRRACLFVICSLRHLYIGMFYVASVNHSIVYVHHYGTRHCWKIKI